MTGISISRENTGTWSNDKDQTSDVCPLCDGARFVYPMLPSGKPDFTRVVPCKCTDADFQKEKLSRIQKLSNLSALARLNFDTLQLSGKKSSAADNRFTAAYQAAKSFAQEPKGWLVFVGLVNSGKTHLACAIANEQVCMGQPVFYISTADLLDHLRATFNSNADMQHDEIFERVKTIPLLVLDDLDIGVTTSWGRGKLEQLLQYRYNAQLATVITTTTVGNLDEAIRGHMGDDDFCHLFVLDEAGSQSLRKLSTLELPLLKNMTFESFNPKRLNLPLEERQNLEQALKIAMNFAQSPEGWLVFQGVNGCGKTHLASAIANHLKRSGRSPLFIVVADLLDHLRAAFSPESTISYDELFEEIKKCQVLILDDFGEQSATSWAQEKLYQLMNYRYNARLATVITTCLLLDDIESRFSSRMVDPSISLVFNIMAPDYRGDTKSKIRRKQRPTLT